MKWADTPTDKYSDDAHDSWESEYTLRKVRMKISIETKMINSELESDQAVLAQLCSAARVRYFCDNESFL